MTSTFPTTRTNSHNLKYGIRELQHKKEILLNLETALKKRVNEFRLLCLREGELTGHLPADYPLQPREPIPQVRRRITRSNGNIPSELQSCSSSGSLVLPPSQSSLSSLRKDEQVSNQVTLTLPNANTHITNPYRPTSTNSTSSTSTASSSLNKQAPNATQNFNHSSMTTNRMHSSNGDVHNVNNYNDPISIINRNNNNKQPTEHTAAMMLQRRQKQLQQQRQQQQLMSKHYDQLFTLPNHFKKPFSPLTANSNFDCDSLGHMRASSTASSSSSSGSAASSTVSAFAAIPYDGQHFIDSNAHGRSSSETVRNDRQPVHLTNGRPVLLSSETSVNSYQNPPLAQQPVRPPRGLPSHPAHGQARFARAPEKQSSESDINGLADSMGAGVLTNRKPAAEAPANFDRDDREVAKFQPYYEETKPFQMSDFYKYSAKHRQQAKSQDLETMQANNKVKTTRQLQEEIATMKQPLKLTACDDQIETSRRLIEQSGLRLRNATAKAIACNPSLAERLNNILPNHHNQGY